MGCTCEGYPLPVQMGWNTAVEGELCDCDQSRGTHEVRQLGPRPWDPYTGPGHRYIHSEPHFSHL